MSYLNELNLVQFVNYGTNKAENVLRRGLTSPYRVGALMWHARSTAFLCNVQF